MIIYQFLIISRLYVSCQYNYTKFNDVYIDKYYIFVVVLGDSYYPFIQLYIYSTSLLDSLY